MARTRRSETPVTPGIDTGYEKGEENVGLDDNWQDRISEETIE